MGRPLTYCERCGRQRKTEKSCESCAAEPSFPIEEIFTEILE